MAKPYRNTLADYVVIGFSPVLLIGLLVCLVWFLLELLYTGQQSFTATQALWQLRYILFWFVLAVVLITRLSLTDNSTKAVVYGLALALVVTIATIKFVNIPTDGPLGRLGLLVPPALLALTWVSAHWITRDCTHINEDEADESANVGVMDTLQENRTKQLDEPAPEKQGRWMSDYQQERAKERRKHAPGTLVVYFSLAALPLFGLGQAIIPSHDLEARRYVFWLLVGYVGCGLGLLMTTSFLGLRRYMYLRKLRMPRTMTSTWLGFGALTVILILTLGAFLPRPDGFITFQTPLEWWRSAAEDEESEEEASDAAVTGGKAGQGEGGGQGQGRGQEQGGNQGGQHDPKAAAQQGGNRGDGNQSGGGQQQGGNQPQAGQPQGQQGGKPQGQQGQQGGQQQGGQQGQQGQQGGQQQGQQGQNRDPQKPNDPDQQQGNKPGGGADPRQERQGARTGARSADGKRNQQRRERSARAQDSANSPVMNVVEKIVWALIILGALFALYWYRRQIWAWLQEVISGPWAWLRSWFKPPEPAGAALPAKAEAAPKPFSSFRNPFDNPSAFPSKEGIVQYSFDAFQSWAYDHRLPRRAEETPLEFADRFGGTFQDLGTGSEKLANLYSMVTYARQPPTEPAMQSLQEFWHLMEKSAPTYLGVA